MSMSVSTSKISGRQSYVPTPSQVSLRISKQMSCGRRASASTSDLATVGSASLEMQAMTRAVLNRHSSLHREAGNNMRASASMMARRLSQFVVGSIALMMMPLVARESRFATHRPQPPFEPIIAVYRLRHRFIEWDPKKDAKKDAPPAAMVVSSTRVRNIFGSAHFKELTPLALDLGVAGRVAARARGAAVQALEGVGEIRYFFDPDKDSESRDRCVRAGSVLG